MGALQSNPHPIQVVVNHWKLRPAAMAARLDELIRQGITHIATFVPWHAVESDISHILPKFLVAACERNLTVSLILTPEIGLHYPYSGVPKGVALHSENYARTQDGRPLISQLPPHAHALPSLLSPEVSKRYQNLLLRVDSLLIELSKTALRNSSSILDQVRCVLTGGPWKYYRAVDGTYGDYSSGAQLQFRARVESHFSGREFTEAGPGSLTRWKSRTQEHINRRWFFQQAEEHHRARALQYVGRRARVELSQAELFTPEAAPDQAYAALLQSITGAKAEASRFATVVEEGARTRSSVAARACTPLVHWTELGAFRYLSDSEKQFLLIQSLLLMGGQGGGILLDEQEWLALSPGFRNRIESLARLITHKGLELKPKAQYLSPHLWSGEKVEGPLWHELFKKLGAETRRVACLDLATSDFEIDLLAVDPQFILTESAVERLVAYAHTGRVVAFPRTALYTDAARRAMDRAFEGPGCLELNLGVQYSMRSAGSGHIVLFDPEGRDFARFAQALLSLANLSPTCNVSDVRLRVVPMDDSESSQGRKGLFIMNPSPRPVTADLLFSNEVAISDLAATLWSHPENPSSTSAYSSRFSLEVPAFGVLPVAVEGLGTDAEERRLAQSLREITQQSAERSAVNELPGLDRATDFGTELSQWS